VVNNQQIPLKGTSRSKKRTSEPSARPYMPGGGDPPVEVLFGIGLTHAFDFGIGVGVTLIVRF